MPQLKIIYFNSFDKWRTPAKTFATLLKLRVKELSKSRISLHQHTLHVPTRSEIHLTRWHLTNSRILLTYLLLFLSMRRCLLFSSLANYVFLYLLLRNFAHITAIRTRNDKRLDTVVISRSYTLQANARSHRIELVKKKKKKKKKERKIWAKSLDLHSPTACIFRAISLHAESVYTVPFSRNRSYLGYFEGPWTHARVTSEQRRTVWQK